MNFIKINEVTLSFLLDALSGRLKRLNKVISKKLVKETGKASMDLIGLDLLEHLTQAEELVVMLEDLNKNKYADKDVQQRVEHLLMDAKKAESVFNNMFESLDENELIYVQNCLMEYAAKRL